MRLRISSSSVFAVAVLSAFAGCSNAVGPITGTGGSLATGGSSSGGTSSGGVSSGGVSSGGVSSGGVSSGGQNSGGVSTGGQSSGGQSSGGRTTTGGGTATGGVSSGGATTASGGASGGQSTAGGGSGGSSAGSTSTGGTGQPPTFATVKFVLENACWGGGCHDDEMNPLHLKVADDNEMYRRITTETTRDCGPLINKTNAKESAFVKLLRGPCGKTPRMPLGECVDDGDSKCIPPDYIAAIEQWIAMGAPK